MVCVTLWPIFSVNGPTPWSSGNHQLLRFERMRIRTWKLCFLAAAPPVAAGWVVLLASAVLSDMAIEAIENVFAGIKGIYEGCLSSRATAGTTLCARVVSLLECRKQQTSVRGGDPARARRGLLGGCGGTAILNRYWLRRQWDDASRLFPAWSMANAN